MVPVDAVRSALETPPFEIPESDKLGSSPYLKSRSQVKGVSHFGTCSNKDAMVENVGGHGLQDAATEAQLGIG